MTILPTKTNIFNSYAAHLCQPKWNEILELSVVNQDIYESFPTIIRYNLGEIAEQLRRVAEGRIGGVEINSMCISALLPNITPQEQEALYSSSFINYFLFLYMIL